MKTLDEHNNSLTSHAQVLCPKCGEEMTYYNSNTKEILGSNEIGHQVRCLPCKFYDYKMMKYD